MNEDVEREEVEECFERAIANVPPYSVSNFCTILIIDQFKEKRYWRRYIWIWIYYAVYEELQAKDNEKCRAVYKAALEVIPHKKFTFAKLWIMFAHFELRMLDVTAARKIMVCNLIFITY
jgi:crooked neck